MRRTGCLGNMVFIEIGRRCTGGPGLVWMYAGPRETAALRETLHTWVFEACLSHCYTIVTYCIIQSLLDWLFICSVVLYIDLACFVLWISLKFVIWLCVCNSLSHFICYLLCRIVSDLRLIFFVFKKLQVFCDENLSSLKWKLFLGVELVTRIVYISRVITAHHSVMVSCFIRLLRESVCTEIQEWCCSSCQTHAQFMTTTVVCVLTLAHCSHTVCKCIIYYQLKFNVKRPFLDMRAVYWQPFKYSFSWLDSHFALSLSIVIFNNVIASFLSPELP